MIGKRKFALATLMIAPMIDETAGEYFKHTLLFFQQVAKDYEALHPDTHISVEVNPWNGYLQKLTTDVNAGTPPDLSIVATIWVPDFASQGVIEPLDSYMTPAFKSIFIPSFFTPSIIDGKLMSIPAAAFYKTMIDDKLTEPSPTAYSREDVFAMFKQGKVGMIFTFPMLIPRLKAESPNLHYAVLPFPTDLKPTTLASPTS